MKVAPPYAGPSGPLRTAPLQPPGNAAGPSGKLAPTPLAVQPARRYTSRPNVFLNLSIGWRLTLGFILAALIAALASGVVGLQRTQSLSKQTDFYHNLLQYNTSLTTAHSFLELMGSKLQSTLDDASSPHPSRETLASDIAAITNLSSLYEKTLNNYVQSDMLDKHIDQVNLLDEANESNLAVQQRTLVNSAQRTWQVYQTAQQQIVTSISNGDTTTAGQILHQQGEPTNADALSALQALIQLHDRLASAVDDATNVEIHNQLLTTLLATFCAFLAIALVGWFISDTLIRRLRHLHRVTQAIEEGRINERVQVTGRDEIADVAIAVNAMVDTITNLLAETRQQRDALTGAAEHLFSDMRIVNAGDLRVSAPVGNDPIGMLADAFNFTVGRFRRFILRTQNTIEQLEVVSRQGLERSNTFISLVRTYLRDTPAQRGPSAPQPLSGKLHLANMGSGPARSSLKKSGLQGFTQDDPATLGKQVQQIQNGVFAATRDDLQRSLGDANETLDAARASLGRLSTLVSSRSGAYSNSLTEKTIQVQMQELSTMEKYLRKLSREVQQSQFTLNNTFPKMDSSLTSLVRSLAELQLPAPLPSESADGSYLQDPQFQEFVRQAGTFALEVNTLAKRLTAIIQEMHSGISPFRLEGATHPAGPDGTKAVSGE